MVADGGFVVRLPVLPCRQCGGLRKHVQVVPVPIYTFAAVACRASAEAREGAPEANEAAV
jgi:hypothetical protein